jgi:alkanesulfonate monooxygenase SsuD/methylene tetrahydromethanopterin reductase-like flavin-dependent oxidoreductase (luciferase family)
VKLGLHIASRSWEGGNARLGPLLTEIVETAEAMGFDMIDTADHVWLHPIVGGPEQNHVEAYTTLSYIACGS